MRSKPRWRTRLYAVTAVTSGILAVLTVIVHDWAELLFRVEPDEGNGRFEAGVTLAIGIVSILFLILTLVEFSAGRRRARTAGESDVV